MRHRLVEATQSVGEVAPRQVSPKVPRTPTKPPRGASKTKGVRSDLWLKLETNPPGGRAGRVEVLADPLLQASVVKVDFVELERRRCISRRPNEELAPLLADSHAVGVSEVNQLLFKLTTDIIRHRNERRVCRRDVASNLQH
jgi:hypothetical protein